MNRYEPGFDRGASTVSGQILNTPSETVPDAGSNEVTHQTEALTNKILASLPAPEFKRLLHSFEPVLVASGEDLENVNDFVYFPESSVVCQLYYLRRGGATAAAVVGNDGLVGLSAVFGSRRPLAYRTRVVIGGNALRVKTQIIREEFERGEYLQRLILTYMNKRMAQVSQRAVCNGRHRLAERLCTWLLMLDDRTVGHSLPLTHADLANHLGTRRAVISSLCHSLRTRGVISYKRGQIIIDKEMLRARACECYLVLKP